MAQPAATPTLNLGFLTVLQDGGGYLGGYLVTNTWGRPLEFRLTSAVQPNRVQQILYAGTLQAYLCADLIGKTLVEKTGIPVQLIVTEREAVLDLRNRLALPVVWLAAEVPRAAESEYRTACVRPAAAGRGALYCHPGHLDDLPGVRALLDRLDPGFDLAEPFQRIREAIQEARKQSVSRAA